MTVELVQPTGSRTYITFPLGGVPTVAELDAHDVQRPGEQIDLDVDMNRAILIDPETDRVHSEGWRRANGQAAETRHQAVRHRGAGAEGRDPAGRRRCRRCSTTAPCATSSWATIEVLRAIAFLVRDENWGTYTPEISNLKIKQGKSGFRVTYDARCGTPSAR